MSSRTQMIPGGGWRGWFIHLAVWGVFGLIFWLASAGSMWLWFLWMVALARHGGVVIKESRRIAQRSKIGARGKPQRGSTSLPAELRSVLAALRSCAPPELDLETLGRAAANLVGRRKDLEASADPKLRSRLERELEEAHTRRSAEEDAVSQHALGEQIDAIEDRLASMSAAATIATRLHARERTLLHQLEDLKMALLRQESVAAGDPEEAGQILRRLNAELEAEAEVEEALSRARLEAKAQLRSPKTTGALPG